MTKGLFKPEEAAEYLGVSRARVYQLIGDRRLDSVKIGKSRRVPREALETFVARLVTEQSGTPSA